MTEICILGAGHQGLAMAAHLALNGEKINMWNRTSSHIDVIANTNQINCSGVVKGIGCINKCSDNISDVISDIVMVTTPSSAHKDLARLLLPFIHKKMVIILNPGRTFGAVEFAEVLKSEGVKELPQIAETQSIVYTCRRTGINSSTIYALKENVPISCLKESNIDYIYSRIPKCIRGNFNKVSSIGYTSLSNVGMILHCAPVLMNIGWIESEIVDFKYYYDGISRSIAAFLEKMDRERMNVAKALGFKIESVMEWLKRTYEASGDCLYECIRSVDVYKEIDAPPTINCRYIFEDVPNGLVPIEFLGKSIGIDVSNITIIIDLAESVTDCNYRLCGRTFSVSELAKYL